MNLLHETIKALTEHGHSPADVVWVGSRDGKLAISWAGFAEIADVEYDAGFGGAEIPLDLVVVCSDGSWLERYEYDGAERWEFKQSPACQPDSMSSFQIIKGDEYWVDLADIQKASHE